MKALRAMLIGALAAVVGVCAFELASGAPRLKSYTSPVLDVDGLTTRVRIQVPEGWEAEPPEFMEAPTAGKRIGPPPNIRATIRIESGPRRSWLPAWLRSLFWHETYRDQYSTLIISVGAREWFSYPSDTTTIVVDQFGPNSGRRIAYRTLKRQLGYEAVYDARSAAEFDSTYNQICDSFSVLNEANEPAPQR